MLTQQLAASRSEDDGRISDMSFHDETLNFSQCPVQQMPLYTL